MRDSVVQNDAREPAKLKLLAPKCSKLKGTSTMPEATNPLNNSSTKFASIFKSDYFWNSPTDISTYNSCEFYGGR
jgi:hypothetical protein